MESSRMTCPSCDPFDQAIIDTIVEYVDGRLLHISDKWLRLFKEDLKWAKRCWNRSVSLIFIDQDGYGYRLTVPMKGIKPKGCYYIEWFGRYEKNEF